jgi:catechol 2,3-dioxygenase-like lactoylglutathione lyase family enzyme
VRGRSDGRSWGVVLEAPDARALARFYTDLLGWPVHQDEPGWVTLAAPDGVASLAFQSSTGYLPPTWPTVEGRQQMMAHLDIEVDDLQVAVASAVELGATVAEFQPQDHVRVLLDPAGHPFCLYVGD